MTPTTKTTTATVHQIVVHPLDRYGTYRVTDRETGQDWVARTRTPACAAARVLKDLGAAPSDRLEMFRDGRDRPDLAGPIGWFAEHAVIETARQGPTYAKYRAFDRDRITG